MYVCMYVYIYIYFYLFLFSPPPPPRSTSEGFPTLDFLISGFLQDEGFQIPDFQKSGIGKPRLC